MPCPSLGLGLGVGAGAGAGVRGKGSADLVRVAQDAVPLLACEVHVPALRVIGAWC